MEEVRKGNKLQFWKEMKLIQEKNPDERDVMKEMKGKEKGKEQSKTHKTKQFEQRKGKEMENTYCVKINCKDNEDMRRECKGGGGREGVRE